jgi:hypothetical protein
MVDLLMVLLVAVLVGGALTWCINQVVWWYVYCKED